MKELTEIDRLDLVAKAEATKALLSRARLPVTLLSLFIVFFAIIISGASFYETLAVWVLATLAVGMTLMLWLDSRYAAYALAILFFAVLIGGWLPFDDPDAHTTLGSTTRAMLSVMFLFGGYQWWTNAMAFTTAQSEEFVRERSQVGEWIGILKSSKKTDQVIEFSTKSFVRGYWTYRLLNTGSCWVVAKFKSGNMARILDCRVLGIDAVRVKDPQKESCMSRWGTAEFRKSRYQPTCVAGSCTR